MANLTSTQPAQSANDAPTWVGLQRAIAISSGFQRWCAEIEQSMSADSQQPTEQLVMAYLRQTLETLAY